MTQIEKLKIRIPEESNEEVLGDLLDSSAMRILAKRYPLSDYPVDEQCEYVLEDRYSDLQLRLSVEMYNIRGAEGETAHSENGTSRSYADYNNLLNEVVPRGKVL